MPLTVRPNDYTLSDEQEFVRESLRTLLARHCSLDTVRGAEPLGFDPGLWARLGGNEFVSLAVPEDAGGQGGGLVELVLLGFELGRASAPVPLVDHVSTLRLVAALAPTDDPAGLAGALRGERTVTLAPAETDSPRRLIPSGALAETVVARVGDTVVEHRRPAPPPAARTSSGSPVAWWDLDGDDVSRTVLGEGAAIVRAWERGVREWRIATAAVLVGMAERAIELTREYALHRMAFGQPIARFQAISHTLVDRHVDVRTATNLCLRAAWLAEHEPDHRPELASIAFVHAARTALRAVSDGVQIHGGLGLAEDSDISLYFRRVAGVTWPAGSVQRELLRVGGAPADSHRRGRLVGAPAPTGTSTRGQ